MAYRNQIKNKSKDKKIFSTTAAKSNAKNYMSTAVKRGGGRL